MDSFTATTKKVEDVVLPPVNEDDGTGSSGSCVVCKEDTSLPTVDEDSGTGSSVSSLSLLDIRILFADAALRLA
ncbi:hypothetical protein DFH08DRAFT_957144 [Mycena albidolilacea]|uniref:Uncharacterized protein n=1 Tax=Mycena albidolilacea TaxID=1033008 RepID=A0AAD7A8V8_9AGAR|nr:hypothetical protein DFH08DRAFT_957144 [Mycena albidolilacea]